MVRGGAGPFHGVRCHVYAVVGAGGELVRCVAVFLCVGVHEVLHLSVLSISGPHGGHVHVVRGAAGHFAQFRGNEAVVSQHGLVHAHFPHFLQNAGALLVVAAYHDDVGILCLDIGELGGEFVIFAAEGFHVNYLYPFVFHGFLEIFLGCHVLFIVVGIHDGGGFIAQNFMGLCHGLGNIF